MNSEDTIYCVTLDGIIEAVVNEQHGSFIYATTPEGEKITTYDDRCSTNRKAAEYLYQQLMITSTHVVVYKPSADIAAHTGLTRFFTAEVIEHSYNDAGEPCFRFLDGHWQSIPTFWELAAVIY